MNRSAVVKAYGTADLISIETSEVPRPGPKEVCIKVEASSLVFTDILIRSDLYPMLKKTLPLTLGYSFVGRIFAVGSEVKGWVYGQRVADLTQTGSNSDYIIRESSSLVSVPDTLDSAEAEALVLSGISAYQSLTRVKSVLPGSRVLITGASGAVGHLAVQIANNLGFRVFGAASKGKAEFINELGGSHLDYLELSSFSGENFDLIIELANKRPVSEMRKLLKPTGTLVFLGMRSQFEFGGNATSQRWRLMKGFAQALVGGIRFSRKSVLYNITGRKVKNPEDYRKDLTLLFSLLEEKKIRPVIVERIPLDEIARGHRKLEEERVYGRLTTIHS